MSILFTPSRIGNLDLKNRLVRSATAEKMADEDGIPKPELKRHYQELVQGGVGLIITGHMYIHSGGKCHTEMTGISSDAHLLSLMEIAESIHKEGGKAVVQINHGGMQCSRESVTGTLAPSDLNYENLTQPARAMTFQEIETTIAAYGQAARRAKQAGFDGVQLHGAHGYLINQFLSPYTNQRQDHWGGSPVKRRNFLREVIAETRKQVGPNFPILIKLGLADGVEHGISLEEGLQTVSELQSLGIDGIEISGGIGSDKVQNTRKGVKIGKNEAYFLGWAKEVRQVTQLPLILVGGFRSLACMEAVLEEGTVDFVSLCRPLICEPDLPHRFEKKEQFYSICISANQCFPEEEGLGVACRCPVDRSKRENQSG